ncbi:MAG: hypothetical protein J0H88_11950 [Sphingomonadales bacterium]|nr:hypothetical protein [Sphingomonadales bacterium]
MIATTNPTTRFGRLGMGAIVLLWIAVAAFALFLRRDSIATVTLPDADDYMRLLQVRDLMAGQSWFDVTQHRVNPNGGGGLMHWSRFIDFQIAGLTMLLQPLLGAAAERWAAALYPVLLILPLFLLFGRILPRLGERDAVIGGMIIAATGATILQYFVPLRIDHHNWQLLLSVAMLALALGSPRFWRGFAAALVITIHVEISLEGIVYLAIFGTLFAIEWLRDPRNAPRLQGFAAGLAVFPALWLLAFRGPSAFLLVHCDAFTRPYLAAVTVTGVLLFAWMRGPERLRATWSLRLVGLAIAGAAGAAAFLILGRECLGGPFGTLEPLVRTYWYENVAEGRPVWSVPIATVWLFAAPTLVGFGATIWAWRASRGGAFAANWDRVAFVVLCSTLLSLLVFRAGATTHAFMVPAFGAMLAALWRHGRSRPSAAGRIAGAMLALVALPATDVLIAQKLTELAGGTQPSDRMTIGSCITASTLAPLSKQPPALLFAPVDIGPKLLEGTPHSVLATGHHRNHAAMNRVITAFLSAPDAAEPIVRSSKAAYVVLCPGLPEVRGFAAGRPAGLAGALTRGQPVSWLHHEAALSRGALQVYSVIPTDQAASKVSAAPLPQ